VDPAQAYVLISNHQSLLDPVVALAAFPGRLTFVAKQELSRVPVFAGAMSAAQVVFVDRKDPARAREQLEHAKQVVAERVSIWFAAEGTRSPDGELGRLKKGAFHVAMALGTPILPTWIDGARDVLPPHSMQTRTGQTVWVSFGPPIATAGVDRRGIVALVERTRDSLLTLQRGAASLR
jgi:1-acyl-sn-glycerol-3-phosphate acyltransferase